MKFANIYYPYGSIYKKQNDTYEAINIGDVFQYLAIENLYKYMGIDTNDIKKINRYELADYNGEYVILPINCLFNGFTSGMNVTCFSSKIIPVFLGFAVVNDYLSENDIDYLKKYEPIGCRDRYTFQVMKKYGIEAWINGCMTLTFPQRERFEGEKILLVDCPDAVKRLVPFCENIEELTHIWNNDYCEMHKKVEERYEYYKKEAKLIITSRLHCAIPCLAAGIPVILAKDSFGTTFSWVEKIIPLYSMEKYQSIDWSGNFAKTDLLKNNMLENAKNRLTDAFNIYHSRYIISEFFETTEDIPIDNHIYRKTIEWIDSNWNKNADIQYGIWGFCQMSIPVIQYIRENYRNAKLIAIFDKYRKFSYHNISSSAVENMRCYENINILIMGNAACDFYKKYNDVCGNNAVYLCY